MITSRLSTSNTARGLLPRCSPLSRPSISRKIALQTRSLTHLRAQQTPFSQASTPLDASSPARPTISSIGLSKTRLDPLWTILPAQRAFHISHSRFQQQQPQGDKTDKAKAEQSTGESSSKDNSKDQETDEGKKEENSDKEEQKKKEDAPPPPPHGDKSPWQVFTDTLRSEFKASKEWNESTKALASSAHQFTESESVKRARAAYEAASGAATSKTSTAFKTTGKAIGKSAAWTWDTTAVKGIRGGVSATARGIEKASRPVRETKVYKTAVGGVKDAMDDGSSSRYGGWVEKEERRKQRELRELNEMKSGQRKAEIMEEDPK